MATTYQNGWVSAKPTAWGLSGDDPSKEPQFAVTFEILEGEDTGKTITWYSTPAASEKALEYLRKGLRKMGWTGTNLSSVDLNDEPVSILIEDEQKPDGSWRQKVKAVGGTGGATFKALDPNRAKAFAAQMEQRIKALDAKSGTTPKPAARPASPPPRPDPNAGYPGVDDSDIPF